MSDLSVYTAEDRRIIAAIEKVRGEGGERYGGTTDLARRNPVKPDTANFLSGFAKIWRPRVIGEIGTAYGYSTCHLGLGYKTAIIHTAEFDPEVGRKAQGILDEAGLDATVHIGDAGKIDYAAWGPIELLFMDHDKSSYLRDFLKIEPFLAPRHAVIFDNVVDRRAECDDLVRHVVEKYEDAQIYPTLAGLLVATQRYGRTT